MIQASLLLDAERSVLTALVRDLRAACGSAPARGSTSEPESAVARLKAFAFVRCRLPPPGSSEVWPRRKFTDGDRGRN